MLWWSIGLFALSAGVVLSEAVLDLKTELTVDEYAFAGKIISFYCANDEVCIFLTDKGEAHLSRDGGVRFLSVRRNLNHSIHETVSFKSVFVYPQHERHFPIHHRFVIHLLDNRGRLFLSENSGASWETIHVEPGLEDFKYCKTYGPILASRVSTSCTDVNGDAVLTCKQLYGSRNLGRTWQLLQEFVIDYDWAQRIFYFPSSGGRHGVSLFSKEAMATVVRPEQRRSDQEFSKWNPNTDLLYSDDFFKSISKRVEGVNKFSITATSSAFYAQIVKPVKKEHVLQICSLSGKNFDKVDLPHGKAWAMVLQDSPYGSGIEPCFNISARAITVHDWILESQYRVLSPNREVDLVALPDSESIFANVKSTIRSNASCVETFVRVGSVGRWRRLSNRVCASKNCSQYIHLHVVPTEGKNPLCIYWNDNGRITDIPAAQISSSFGVIVAAGNAGECLDFNPMTVSTYLSRDSGLSWSLVAPGIRVLASRLYRGMLYLVPAEPTFNLFGSPYQRHTWQSYHFTENLLENATILEPHGLGSKFFVAGHRIENTAYNGSVLVSIVSPKSFDRKCILPTGAENSDFKWEPALPVIRGSKTGGCVQGSRFFSLALKTDSVCEANLETLGVSQTKPCKCRREDVTCRIGFVEKFPGGPCIRILTVDSLVEQVGRSLLSVIGHNEAQAEYPYIRAGGNSCVGGFLEETSHETRLACTIRLLLFVPVGTCIIMRLCQLKFKVKTEHAFDRMVNNEFI